MIESSVCTLNSAAWKFPSSAVLVWIYVFRKIRESEPESTFDWFTSGELGVKR